MFMVIVLQLAVTLLAALSGFVFSYIIEKKRRAYDMMKKRYFEFYAPFIHQASVSLLDRVKFHELLDDKRAAFAKILNDNRSLATETEQIILAQLGDSLSEYATLMMLKEIEKISPLLEQTDSCFERLSAEIGKEYIRLSKCLKLPLPYLPPLKYDSQTRQELSDRIRTTGR